MVDLSISQDLIVALVKYYVPSLIFIVLLKLFLPKIKGYIGEKSVSNHLSKLPSDHYFTFDDVIKGIKGGIDKYICDGSTQNFWQIYKELKVKSS